MWSLRWIAALALVFAIFSHQLAFASGDDDNGRPPEERWANLDETKRATLRELYRYQPQLANELESLISDASSEAELESALGTIKSRLERESEILEALPESVRPDNSEQLKEDIQSSLDVVDGALAGEEPAKIISLYKLGITGPPVSVKLSDFHLIEDDIVERLGFKGYKELYDFLRYKFPKGGADEYIYMLIRKKNTYKYDYLGELDKLIDEIKAYRAKTAGPSGVSSESIIGSRPPSAIQSSVSTDFFDTSAFETVGTGSMVQIGGGIGEINLGSRDCPAKRQEDSGSVDCRNVDLENVNYQRFDFSLRAYRDLPSFELPPEAFREARPEELYGSPTFGGFLITGFVGSADDDFSLPDFSGGVDNGGGLPEGSVLADPMGIGGVFDGGAGGLFFPASTDDQFGDLVNRWYSIEYNEWLVAPGAYWIVPVGQRLSILPKLGVLIGGTSEKSSFTGNTGLIDYQDTVNFKIMSDIDTFRYGAFIGSDFVMPVGNFLGHPLSLNGGVELRGIRNDVDGRTTADVMSYGVLSGYPPYNVSSSQEFSDEFCDIGLSLNFAATLGLSERASVSIGGGFETWDIGVPSLVPGEQAKVEREERNSYHIGASLDISF